MSTIVRIQDKGQITIAAHLRAQAGPTKGNLVEAAFERGRIVLTPKVAIGRSKFPPAGGEYTPAQRRTIDRGIAQSMKEFRQARGIGPFSSHEGFIEALQKGSAPQPRKPKRAQR